MSNHNRFVESDPVGLIVRRSDGSEWRVEEREGALVLVETSTGRVVLAGKEKR